MCKSLVFDNWVWRSTFRFIPLSTETIKFTSLCAGQLFVIPHYLQREIACADIHKRLTVMRIHVNQAVICKDKTKDKLFKKHSDYYNAYPWPISMQSSSKSPTSVRFQTIKREIFYFFEGALPKFKCIKRRIIESGCTSTFFMPQKGLSFNFAVEKLLLQTRNYIRSFAYDECRRPLGAGRENVLLVI